MLTNKVNGKRYIGQTLQLDIKPRWQAYKSLTKTSIGNYLYNALVKWGVDNFKFQIVCVCFDDDCNAYEVKYIEMYNTVAPHGYNLQSGGDNYKAHPSTIEKMRASLTGRKVNRNQSGEKNPNFGKPMSDEQKTKISNSLKGKKIEKTRIRTPWVPRIVDKYDTDHKFIETFNTLSDAGKSIGTSGPIICKYATQGILYRNFYWKVRESPDRTDNLKLGCEANKKKVAQYTLDHQLVATYPSFSEAARAIDGCVSYLSRCADEREKYKNHQTHKGFIWKLVQ